MQLARLEICGCAKSMESGLRGTQEPPKGVPHCLKLLFPAHGPLGETYMQVTAAQGWNLSGWGQQDKHVSWSESIQRHSPTESQQRRPATSSRKTSGRETRETGRRFRPCAPLKHFCKLLMGTGQMCETLCALKATRWRSRTHPQRANCWHQGKKVGEGYRDTQPTGAPSTHLGTSQQWVGHKL